MPDDLRDIPYNMTQCLAIKAQGKKLKRGLFRVNACPPKQPLYMTNFIFPRND